ncbi:MAG: zinc ribbon domain-containing protein [Deltaproteobacteria bacterium]|nr:zinc ribbon domain-containing protein [Deltaproteobacteria bacterium]
MALQTCPDCGNELSDKAIACPRCGRPGPAPTIAHKGGYEWKSRVKLFGIPLVHVAFGSDQKGSTRVAKGFVAIGQFGIGAVTIAQFGVGVLLGAGQCVVGFFGIGQAAVGIILGVGQFAGGLLAIGQIVVGIYGFCQAGWARYLWSPDRVDMEAVALFSTLALRASQLLGLQ